MKKRLVLLILILLICFVLHLLAITKVPPGLNNDEVVDGYDAYSILITGKDQWNTVFPLEFKSFGDNKLPLFIYSLVPFVYFFGLNAFSLRLAAALFAVLLVWAVFLLAKKLFNETIAILACLLLTISPWFFSLSRAAHEGPLHTAFIVFGLYFFLKALKKEKFYIPSFIFFSLSFYTYHTARLFVPLLLTILIILYRKKIYQQRKVFLLSLVLAVFLCLPIFVSLFNGKASARLIQTNIIKDSGTIDLLNEKRGECMTKAPFIVCRAIYNKPAVFTQKFISNYLHHFSLDFLFLEGSAKGVMGTSNYLYFSIIPFLAIGIYFLFKEKKEIIYFLGAWFVAAPVADSLTSAGHYSRSFILIVPIVIVVSLGIYKTYKKIISNTWKKLFISVLALFLLFETGSFCADYFFHYPKYFSMYTHYEYEPLFEYLKTIEDDYSQIYISSRTRDTKQYAFYLFYNKYSPKDFQEKKDVEWTIEDNGWIRINRIGKFHFIPSIPDIESLPDNSLLIGDPKTEINSLITTAEIIPEKEKPLIEGVKTIKFLNEDPAFSIVQLIKEQSNDF